jgi:protein TonB
MVFLLTISVIDLRAQDNDVVKPGPGITLPKPTHEQQPRYTKEAMAAGIEGSVMMTLVVGKEGTVGRVEVIRSLDTKYGLDASAVSAARQWRFEPGRKDGKPVAVEIVLEMTFSLRQKKEQK